MPEGNQRCCHRRPPTVAQPQGAALVRGNGRDDSRSCVHRQPRAAKWSALSDRGELAGQVGGVLRSAANAAQPGRRSPRSKGFVAHATTAIKAPVDSVWEALVNPAMIRQYFFGTEVVSEWREGSVIRWKGEWQGKPYEDKGVILQLKPGRRLQYTHFSPGSGLPDSAENYHTVNLELSPTPPLTQVSLSQDNNASEQSREHSEKNWQVVLSGLKAYWRNERRTNGALLTGFRRKSDLLVRDRPGVSQCRLRKRRQTTGNAKRPQRE
jgi:uncharacterized protein YndB with AHSA1/START domain